MNFLEAVSYAYKNRRRDEDITTPTVFYAILSDLCGASYEDKKKLLLFFDLDKRYRIMNTLCEKRENDIDRLTEEFCAGESNVSEEHFEKLINSISKAIGIPVHNKEQKVRQTITPVTTYSQQHNLKTLKKILLAVGVAIVITCAILLGVFAKNITWYVWQWIIGSGVGAFFTAVSIAIVWKLDDEMIVDFHILGTVLLGIFLVANAVLTEVFQSQYKIIAIWMCGFEISSGIFLCIKSFCNWENVFGFIQIVEIVAIIALLLSIFLI